MPGCVIQFVIWDLSFVILRSLRRGKLKPPAPSPEPRSREQQYLVSMGAFWVECKHRFHFLSLNYTAQLG